jgi:hypothetical protein
MHTCSAPRQPRADRQRPADPLLLDQRVARLLDPGAAVKAWALDHPLQPLEAPLEQGNPLGWDLGMLSTVATRAGWFSETVPPAEPQYVDLRTADLGDAVRWVKWARNLVHPGAFVRDMPPGLEIGDIAFKNAYAVLDGAFSVTADVLDKAAAEDIWS